MLPGAAMGAVPPYMTWKNDVPWFPVEVTQPTAPVLLTRTFMRMSPDLSSFLGHSSTSTTSPTFNFASFFGSLPPPPNSKESVRRVSFELGAVVKLLTHPEVVDGKV